MDSRWQSDLTDDSRTEHRSSRDLILLKCKETIEALTTDLERERQGRLSAEQQTQDLHQDFYALEGRVEMLQTRERALEEEVEARNYENGQLKKRVLELSEEGKNLKTERNDYEAKQTLTFRSLKNAQEALERTKTELDSKDTSVKEWNRTLKELERKMSEIARENDQLRKEKDQYSAKFTKESEQSQYLQSLIENLQAENADFQSKLKSATEDYRRQIAILERQKSVHQQEVTEAFNRKATQYHEQLTQGLQEQKSLISKATDEVARLETANGNLNTRLSEALSLLEVKRKDYDALNRDRNELEQELHSTLNDLDELQKTQKQELEVKDKMNASLTSKLEEERQQVAQCQSRLQEVLEELSHREEFYTTQKTDLEAKLKRAENDRQQLAVELQEAKDEIWKTQESANESFQRMKSDHEKSLQQTQYESEQRRDTVISTLEARLKEMESQRESDHEYFQIELLRLKDNYTQTLISKEEQLRLTKAERDRLSNVVEENQSRLVNMARTASNELEKPSLKFGARRYAKSPRATASLSMNQVFDSPRNSRDSTDWNIPVSPLTSRSHKPLPSEGDGLQLLSQLKELTTRLERSVSTNRYA